MKKFLLLFLFLAVGSGCARVRVEAPKEAIKVDVSMRLDIYQHIEKDIDKIENMVSGSEKKPLPADNQSFLSFLVSPAYAEDGLRPEVEAAALRRKDRRSELVALEEKGILGENSSGMVEVREKSAGAAVDLSLAENQDRMIIYKSIAEKNGSSLKEVQRLYAKRLQADAPAGTPIEILNADGSSTWKVK